MTVYIVYDDPYNMGTLLGFTSEEGVAAYTAVNGGYWEPVILDEHVGHKEYRVWHVVIRQPDGKQLSEDWNDTISTEPPIVPGTRARTQHTRQFESTSMGLIDHGTFTAEIIEAWSDKGITDALAIASAFRKRYQD